MAKDCIFCQICERQLPASVVYEDELAMAFMDIHPLGRGHVLVIPKEHAQQLTDIGPDLQAHLFQLANRILHAQRALGWGVNGSHLLVNDGKRANQIVPHIHLHLIPREKGDALRSLGRLLLHVTGVFGPAVKRAVLDDQAKALREQMELPCCEA